MNNGYKNEINFANSINGRKYCDLSNNLKNFIKFIFNNVKDTDILECKRYKTYDKADIYIKLNGKTKNVSIKSGIRISVHAEKINSFISFLKEIHISEKIINYLLLYHYGDFTLNGTGRFRLSAKELKNRYEKELKIVNKYVNHKNIVKKIVTRCLFEGTSKRNKADYIYYGNEREGLYASREEIVKYMCDNIASEIIAPHFSYLILQNWNRNIVYNSKLEKHRYYCQFKWPSVVDDLQKIRELNK